MLTEKEQSLVNALEPRAIREGVEIVTVEVVGSRKSPTIRIYIDTEEGVSFDELAQAQSWINQTVEELDPFPGAYVLEVSSPGIDRPLRTPEHFMRFKGSTAFIKTFSAIEGRLNWTGTIAHADDQKVSLNVDGEDIDIAYKNIKRAHLKGTIDFNRV